MSLSQRSCHGGVPEELARNSLSRILHPLGAGENCSQEIVSAEAQGSAGVAAGCPVLQELSARDTVVLLQDLAPRKLPSEHTGSQS